jgi:hypothetical protein
VLSGVVRKVLLADVRAIHVHITVTSIGQHELGDALEVGDHRKVKAAMVVAIVVALVLVAVAAPTLTFPTVLVT